MPDEFVASRCRYEVQLLFTVRSPSSVARTSKSSVELRRVQIETHQELEKRRGANCSVHTPKGLVLRKHRRVFSLRF